MHERMKKKSYVIVVFVIAAVSRVLEVMRGYPLVVWSESWDFYGRPMLCSVHCGAATRSVGCACCVACVAAATLCRGDARAGWGAHLLCCSMCAACTPVAPSPNASHPCATSWPCRAVQPNLASSPLHPTRPSPRERRDAVRRAATRCDAVPRGRVYGQGGRVHPRRWRETRTRGRGSHSARSAHPSSVMRQAPLA